MTFRVLFVLAMVLMPVMSAAAQQTCQGAVPAATGKYHVSTWTSDYTDASRPEEFVQGERRRFSVKFFYPTLASGALGPYAEGGSAEAIKDVWPVPVDFGWSFCVSLAAEGSARAGGQRFPVVLFSPGLSWPPAAYASLLIDLASHGYIVGAVSHPHAIARTVFADGTVVDMSRWPKIADEQARQAFLARYLETWMADLRHLGQAIESGDAFRKGPLHDGIDLAAGIGLLGHSYGGSAAARALDGRLFRVGVAMEGRYRGPASAPVAVNGVLMHMIGGYNRAELEGEHYRAGSHPLYEVVVNGAGHSSFSDLVLLYTRYADEEWKQRHRNELTPSRALEITRTYLRAFFDAWMKGVDSPYLHPVSNAARFDRPSRSGFPEVELQIDVLPAVSKHR